MGHPPPDDRPPPEPGSPARRTPVTPSRDLGSATGLAHRPESKIADGARGAAAVRRTAATRPATQPDSRLDSGR